VSLPDRLPDSAHLNIRIGIPWAGGNGTSQLVQHPSKGMAVLEYKEEAKELMKSLWVEKWEEKK
jgi:hypothetical protein